MESSNNRNVGRGHGGGNLKPENNDTSKNTQESNRKRRIWDKLIAIILAVIGSGLFGSWITSIYSDRIAKREITANVLEIVSDNLFETKNIPTKIEEATDEQLSEMLARREHAFFVRKTTDFLVANYPNIKFDHILPAITEIETRYSYARLYEAAGMVDILAENLFFLEGAEEEIEISETLSRGYSENLLFLDGMVLKLVSIDVTNQNFRIKIEKDYGNILCYQKGREKQNCEYIVDLTDRIESLPYENMIITEYIGYVDPFGKKDPIVFFSIVSNKARKEADRTYWEYELAPFVHANTDNRCEAFFDHDDETISKPPPPVLDVFDRAVLRSCGSLGGKATRDEFKRLIYDNFDQIIRSYDDPPSKWKEKTKIEIINEIHRIWSLYGGFNHIFCGDWDRGSIGGLHDRSRYLQLQIEGAACYDASPIEDILPGHVYNMGVRSSDHQFKHKIKGYALNNSSLDLFLLTMQAFYNFGYDPQGWRKKHERVYSSKLYEKNLYLVTQERGKTITFRVLFYASDLENPLTYGIKTIYPDITPDEGYPRVELK